jgi:hypothetical protein
MTELRDKLVKAWQDGRYETVAAVAEEAIARSEALEAALREEHRWSVFHVPGSLPSADCAVCALLPAVEEGARTE